MSMSNYFVCSVQRFATVCYVQIHVLCVLKNLRNDQRAPGGLNSRKSDLVFSNRNYFIEIVLTKL